MFPAEFRLDEAVLVRYDMTLFSAQYRARTMLWSLDVSLTDLSIFLRAFRRIGTTGEVFLDQMSYLVDDMCYCPSRELEEVMAQFVKALDRKAIEAARRTAASDEQLAVSHPALFEFLTLTAVGKEPRETSRLSLFTEDGSWKCFLNDPHTGRYCCVTAKSFAGVLDALEGKLCTGEADWRVSNGSKKR